jgi:hypothetical protein
MAVQFQGKIAIARLPHCNSGLTTSRLPRRGETGLLASELALF